MNENTTKLLEQLAGKLGTTSEYLWKILIKQAPIDATISIVYLVISIVMVVALYKIHCGLMKPVAEGKYRNSYDRYEGAIVPMIVCTTFCLLFFAFSIRNINSIISGYFNPEYWALNKVLNAIGSK